MTLTDSGDTCDMQTLDKKTMKVGEALREAVWQALDQGRLACGAFECAKLLEIDPFNVMFCILPEDVEDDVGIHIQHTLIEAFCHENDIKILKVDNCEKLSKVVMGRSPLPLNDNDVAAGRSCADVSCVLIQYPEDGNSMEDQVVYDFFKAQGKLGNVSVVMPS